MKQNARPEWAQIATGGNGLLSAGVPILLFIYVFTPARIVQLIALFFLFVLLGSKVYSEYLIRHLRLTRADTELRVFRHEWVEVEIAVENNGRLPAFLTAFGDSPGDLAVFRNNKLLCTLWGRRRRIIRWTGYGSDRGLFHLGPAMIRSADPLGLFPFTLVSAVQARLYVYPPVGFVSLKPPDGIPLGSIITGNPFDEDLTRGRSLREYYPGDEMRRINWKASARTQALGGSLMVNEYESTLSYPLVVFLNADPAEYPLKKRELHLERSIEAAAAVCLMASRERQSMGFILHTKRGELGEGVIRPAASTLIPILERLAVFKRRDLEEGEAEAASGASAPEAAPEAEAAVTERTGAVDRGSTAAMRTGAAGRGSTARMLDEGKFLPFGTRLVYVGPWLDEEDYRVLDSLRKYHLTLEYLIVDERSLPLGGKRYQMKEAGYEVL